MTKNRTFDYLSVQRANCMNCTNLIRPTSNSIYCRLAQEFNKSYFHLCQNSRSLYRDTASKESWWEWDRVNE